MRLALLFLLLSLSCAFAPVCVAGQGLHAFDPALRDTAADPCVDFYQYACGGWLKAHPVPADRSSYGRDTEVEDASDAVLRGILEQAAAGGHGREADEQKIGDAYAACMDTAAIDAAGLKPLAAQLAAIDAVVSKKALPELLAAMHREGADGFFQFGPQPDARDAARVIAAVTQPLLGLPEKGYYERTDGASAQLRELYVRHIRRTFLLLGEEKTQAARDANTALRVETRLAAASLTEEELREPKLVYHRTPLAQFEANSPELGFARYLRAVGAPAVGSLNVAEPLYFLSLEELLGTISLADSKVYLRWTLVRSMRATALPRALDEEDFAFYGQTLNGTPEQQPRWKRCLETVDGELGDALGKVYVAQRFSPAEKARTEEMTRAIEAAADRDLRTLPWMSEETRAEARRKLRLVANNIGYPAKWRDYSSLEVARNDAFGNAERAGAFERARQEREIGGPVDRGEWEMTAPAVNAFYDPHRNSVNFPAGILQPPYFDPTQNDAVNFGSAGAVIGHELTHGFDDEGRQFDGLGNLRDWWSAGDARAMRGRLGSERPVWSGNMTGFRQWIHCL